MTFSEPDTQAYYDSFGRVYEDIWSPQIHTGFFDKDKSLEVACQDMNDYLAHKAGIQKGKNLLNAGCGRGGTDRFLAFKYKMNVTGIDISIKQLNEAKIRAGRLDVAYMQASMTYIPSVNSAYDYVWAQQSLFHCHDKEKVLREFFRILRPGGFVIIEDTVLLNVDSRTEVLESFGRRLKLTDVNTVGEYINLFKKSGFEVKDVEDLSFHLGKTYRKVIDNVHKDINLDFSKTYQLVQEGKLGCIYALIRTE